MALCFAHTTAGYLAYEAVRPAGRHRPGLLVAGVLLANAPDLDFVPGWLLGHPGMYHRGITHTIAAVVAVGTIAALVWWWRGHPARAVLRVATWVALVYGSHLLLDYFTTNVRAPSGGQFLWPFSDAYWIAPVTPLGEILIDGSNRMAFLRSLLGPETYHVWFVEIAESLLVVTALRLLRARAVPAPVPVREVSEES